MKREGEGKGKERNIQEICKVGKEVSCEKLWIRMDVDNILKVNAMKGVSEKKDNHVGMLNEKSEEVV